MRARHWRVNSRIEKIGDASARHAGPLVQPRLFDGAQALFQSSDLLQQLTNRLFGSQRLLFPQVQ